jgi:hypothetical protein
VRDMGCYLEDYRAGVGAWATRFSWRSAVRRVGTRGGNCMGQMILCAAVLATLLLIGGVELNPGPVDSIVQSCVVATTET